MMRRICATLLIMSGFFGGELSTRFIYAQIVTGEYLPDIETHNPLVISAGGVYENLKVNSTEYGTPAIRINTSEQVIIRNCVVSGSGDLIVSSANHAKIKISNNYIWGRNPDIAGKQQGRSVKVENVDYFIFMNNFTGQTGGLRIRTMVGSEDTTVWIQGNIHKDLTSLISNGTGEAGRAGYDLSMDEGGEWNRQMVILNNVNTPSGSMAPRIQYNLMENNEYNPDNVSSTEDLINIFGSSGEDQENPIIITKNFLRGAHGNEPFNNYRQFSGTAIILDASDASGADFGYVRINENFTCYIQNAGIAVSSGHHCDVYDNVILNPLYGEDGEYIHGYYDLCGYLWAWKPERPVSDVNYFNNLMFNYSTRGKEPGSYSRNDFWGPDCFENNNACYNNVHLKETITHDDILEMYCEYYNVLVADGVTLGPDWGLGVAMIDVDLKACEMIPPVSGVTLNKSELTLEAGDHETLVATVQPENASGEVEWSSANNAIVTVSGGEVTGISAGITQIVVTTSKGGFSDTCQVIVGSNGIYQKESERLIIFPNPANERITVRIPAGLFEHLFLYNAVGQEIKHLYIRDSYRSLILDIGDCPGGIYTVSLRGKSNRISSRFIKYPD